MSWAAHELESYFLQKHVKVKVSYLAILLGCVEWAGAVGNDAHFVTARRRHRPAHS